MTRRIAVSIIALAGTFLFASSAVAQNKGGGVIRLEEYTIEGRVHKPNAFFINTRQGAVYEALEIRESFLNEIPKVVEDGSF